MNLNKCFIIGRLGRDPEIRYTQSAVAVANFSIATSEKWKDKQGQSQEKTEWHNIVAWGKLAEFAQNYLTKGKLIWVEGKLQTSDWEKDGVKHYKTEINAQNMQFMEPKGDDSSKPAPQVDDANPYIEDDIPF